MRTAGTMQGIALLLSASVFESKQSPDGMSPFAITMTVVSLVVSWYTVVWSVTLGA